MFVKKSMYNKRVFLSFVQGYRINGKVRHKTIEKIGYLSELEKIYEDPIGHFQSIAKERNLTEAKERKLEVLLMEHLVDNTSARKNLGYAPVKDIYRRLGIVSFFQGKQKHLSIGYNLNSIFSLLVFNRFLYPSSKKRAYERRTWFFEEYDFSLKEMYRGLDYFARYTDELQAYLHQQICQKIGRKQEVGYYDVTNYYFEIPYNDEDQIDDKGNIISKGFRRKGPSKEHRRDPIVQMGLLMDSNGIPMAFDIFSGGESEKTSLLPIIRRVKRDYGLKRIIAVADRGLNTSDNTLLLSGTNNDPSFRRDGYVYGQSVLSADKEFKKWVLDQTGYVNTPQTDKDGEEVIFRHKSRIYGKKIILKDGKRKLAKIIYQKQMVYYSQKYADKQKKEREIVLTKAKDFIQHPGKYTQATSVGAAKYIKDIHFVKETGEIPEGVSLSLHLEKIQEEEQYDGFYSIVTSEAEISDQAMRNIYKGLWEIEESFKMIKSEFRARPIYVKIENHIKAHFLICFVCLLIMRVMEYQLGKHYPFTRIRESLKNYSGSHIDQNYYLFDYRDEILKSIEKVYGMDLSYKIMTPSQIKKIVNQKTTQEETNTTEFSILQHQLPNS